MLRGIRSAAAPIVKAGLSEAALRSGLYALASKAYGGAGVIIMLHRIVKPGTRILYPGFTISQEQLDQLLQYALRCGLEIVSLDEVERRLKSASPGKRFVCFVADDGYVDNLEIALPVFRKYDAPFAVYICTGFLDRSLFYWWGGLEALALEREEIEFLDPVARVRRVLPARTWPEKRHAYDTLDDLCHQAGDSLARELFERYRIDAAAALDREAMTVHQARSFASDPLVTIGAHGITHARLAQMTDAASYEEICGGRRRLEQLLGVSVRHLAYPFGGSDACGFREFSYARKAGYATAVTTRPGSLFPEHRTHLHCLPRRVAPSDRIGIRHALSGAETLFRRLPRFQTA